MNCELLMAGAMPPALGGTTENAARFADLVNRCPGPSAVSGPEVYVAGAAPGGLPNTGPMLDILSKLQELQLPSRHSGALGLNPADAGAAHAELDARQIGDLAISMQQELLRTTIVMETVSITKQGVTTLFQLQG